MIKLENIYSDEEINLQAEQQLKAIDCAEPVDFFLISVKEGQSSKGNDQLIADYELSQHGNVFKFTVRDWIVLNKKGLPEKKVKGFFKAIGLLTMYESKEIDAYTINSKPREGKLMIAQDRPYVDKNGVDRIGYSVTDYLPAENVANDFHDDDIPF